MSIPFFPTPIFEDKKKKKQNYIDIKWDKQGIRVFFNKKLGWEIVPLENQYISQEDKIKIVKAVLNNV